MAELEPLKARDVERMRNVAIEEFYRMGVVRAMQMLGILADLPVDAKGNVLAPEMKVYRLGDGKQYTIKAVSVDAVTFGCGGFWDDADAVSVEKPEIDHAE